MMEKENNLKSQLEELSLSDLHQIKDKITNLKYEYPIDRLVENIRVKLSIIFATIKAFCRSKGLEDENKIHKIFKKIEQEIIDNTGASVDIEVSEELQQTLEQIGEKGILVFTNHQGGGIETFISRVILEKLKDTHVHWALKSNLLKIPFYGEILRKSQSIVIERDPNKFKSSVRKFGKDMAGRLKTGRIVVIAFEGTRSKDGEICYQHKRLASTFKLAIKKYIKDDEFEQVLMTIDGFTALPQAIEKNPLGRTAMKGKIKVVLNKIDKETSLRPREGDGGNNIFSISEKVLKEILVRNILSNHRPKKHLEN